MNRVEKKKEYKLSYTIEEEQKENSDNNVYLKAKWGWMEGRLKKISSPNGSKILETMLSINMAINHSHVIRILTFLPGDMSVLYESFEKTLDKATHLSDIYLVRSNDNFIALTDIIKESIKGIISALIDIRHQNLMNVCTDTLCLPEHIAVSKDNILKLIITGSLHIQSKPDQLLNIRKRLKGFIDVVGLKCGIPSSSTLLHSFKKILCSRSAYRGDVLSPLLKHPLLLSYTEKKNMLFEACSWWKQSQANSKAFNSSVYNISRQRVCGSYSYGNCYMRLIKMKAFYVDERICLSDDDIEYNNSILSGEISGVNAIFRKSKYSLSNTLTSLATLLHNLLVHGWDAWSPEFPFTPISTSEADVILLFEQAFPYIFEDIFEAIHFVDPVNVGESYERRRLDFNDARYPKSTGRYP